MKKLIKGAFIIGGLCLLVIVAAAMFAAPDEAGVVREVEKAEQSEPKAEQKPGKAEFDQVKSGMTILEVQKILGPGSMDAESESGGMKVQMYSWEAAGEIGANITVSFTNGKSDSKAQYGLK